MKLTIQIYIHDSWVDAATLTLINPEKGYKSPCKLSYDIDYALDVIDSYGSDERACSLRLPIELAEQHYHEHWFPFMEDIVPSGAARHVITQHLDLRSSEIRDQYIQLLVKGSIAPVGNLRIKEAVRDHIVSRETEFTEYSVSEVIEKNANFIYTAMNSGGECRGAFGAVGEAPKILLRQTDHDTVWIDTYQKSFTNPDRFYLVKFPRGKRSKDDCDVLRAEYHFYHELAAMGFDTIDTQAMRLEEGKYPSLWLPRFDIEWQEDRWVKYGLESISSALGKPAGSYLNHFDIIRELCKILSHKKPEFDSEKLVCEWVCRDLLNIAFGNSDNHGRNSSLLKKPTGLWLAPIYDFAPMKADPEGVCRTTLWGRPYEAGSTYHWQKIIEQLNDLCPQEKLLFELRSTARQLVGLKKRLEARGVPQRILNMPAVGLDSLDDRLRSWNLV